MPGIEPKENLKTWKRKLKGKSCPNKVQFNVFPVHVCRLVITNSPLDTCISERKQNRKSLISILNMNIMRMTKNIFINDDNDKKIFMKTR